jgi:aryl carrier-like protein
MSTDSGEYGLDGRSTVLGSEIALRLSQARFEALAGILGEITDAELESAVNYLSGQRSLDVAATGLRGAKVVARHRAQWGGVPEEGLLNLWRTIYAAEDRVGLDSLLGSFPDSVLVAALGEGTRLLTWGLVDKRADLLDDALWVSLVAVSQGYDELLAGAAAGRGQWSRVGALLDSPKIDGDGLLAHLVASRPLCPWLVERLEGSYERLLSRFAQVQNQRLELPTGPVLDGETAEALARSSHAGLRRLAAASVASDRLVRAKLLADTDPALDSALCAAPLDTGELMVLMERLRKRGVPIPEARNLLFQPEPLSTTDRLWLLRAGEFDLTRSWVGGLSAQDPRQGEIDLLLRHPGRALAGEGCLDDLLEAASGTGWIDELEIALQEGLSVFSLS